MLFRAVRLGVEFGKRKQHASLLELHGGSLRVRRRQTSEEVPCRQQRPFGKVVIVNQKKIEISHEAQGLRQVDPVRRVLRMSPDQCFL